MNLGRLECICAACNAKKQREQEENKPIKLTKEQQELMRKALLSSVIIKGKS